MWGWGRDPKCCSVRCEVHNERLHHKVRCWLLLATRWIQETLLCRYFVTCYSVTPPEWLGMSNLAWSPGIVILLSQGSLWRNLLGQRLQQLWLLEMEGDGSHRVCAVGTQENVSRKQEIPESWTHLGWRRALRSLNPTVNRTLPSRAEVRLKQLKVSSQGMCVQQSRGNWEREERRMIHKYFITRYRNKVCWHLFFFPSAAVAV